MCLTCGKHNAENLWYLQKERHRIRSLGLVKDNIHRHLNSLVETGIGLVRSKQPNYAENKMNVVSRELLNWCAKTLHGVQVLPNMESAFEVIDLANELAVVPCICHKVLAEDEQPLYRCLVMNIAAKIYLKDSAVDVKPITKPQAKELVSSWRQRGAWQSVGWLWDANVIWVCNCDTSCVSYRAPEVEWGGVPSFVCAVLGQPDRCTSCGDCLDSCPFAALTWDESERPVIDPGLCKGCGLCLERCPSDALVFEPRQDYYDVVSKRRRKLGGGEHSL